MSTLWHMKLHIGTAAYMQRRLQNAHVYATTGPQCVTSTHLDIDAHRRQVIVKRIVFALAGALIAVGRPPGVRRFLARSSHRNGGPIGRSAGRQCTSFDPAAVAQLSWDSTKSRPAAEDTIARIATDGKFLYVRFDATQTERIVSTQPVDAKSSGDLVWVEPAARAASNATIYHFASSPDGSSGATASTGTAPAFTSVGSDLRRRLHRHDEDPVGRVDGRGKRRRVERTVRPRDLSTAATRSYGRTRATLRRSAP